MKRKTLRERISALYFKRHGRYPSDDLLVFGESCYRAAMRDVKANSCTIRPHVWGRDGTCAYCEKRKSR